MDDLTFFCLFFLLAASAAWIPGDQRRPMVRYRKLWGRLCLYAVVAALLSMGLVSVVSKVQSLEKLAVLLWLVALCCFVASPLCLLVAVVCWLVQPLSKPEVSAVGRPELGYRRHS